MFDTSTLQFFSHETGIISRARLGTYRMWKRSRPGAGRRMCPISSCWKTRRRDPPDWRPGRKIGMLGAKKFKFYLHLKKIAECRYTVQLEAQIRDSGFSWFLLWKFVWDWNLSCIFLDFKTFAADAAKLQFEGAGGNCGHRSQLFGRSVLADRLVHRSVWLESRGSGPDHCRWKVKNEKDNFVRHSLSKKFCWKFLLSDTADRGNIWNGFMNNYSACDSRNTWLCSLSSGCTTTLIGCSCED